MIEKQNKSIIKGLQDVRENSKNNSKKSKSAVNRTSDSKTERRFKNNKPGQPQTEQSPGARNNNASKQSQKSNSDKKGKISVNTSASPKNMGA